MSEARLKLAVIFLSGVAVSLSLLVHSPAIAQSLSDPKTDSTASLIEKIERLVLPEDFTRLNARKKKLETDIAELSKERDQQSALLEGTKTKLRFAEERSEKERFFLRDLENYRSRLTGGNPKDFPDLKERLDRVTKDQDSIKGRIARADEEVAKAKLDISGADTGLKRAADKLTSGRADLSLVEQTIDYALNVEASRLKWRTVIAAMFCTVLVFLIWWFFKIAQADDVVRRAVFSAHAGIQFLTLFCLVISIVLFGVAGILEGKELSALLGGLSGYILGRVTTSGPSTPSEIAASASGLTQQVR